MSSNDFIMIVAGFTFVIGLLTYIACEMTSIVDALTSNQSNQSRPGIDYPVEVAGKIFYNPKGK